MKITGTDAGESLTGTGDSDTIKALGGDDTVHAGAGDDTVDGGSGNDILDGGIGADILIGGTGGDTYYVDNARDQVVERNDSGIDIVMAAVSFSLSGSFVEGLTLVGTNSINAMGNSLGNVLTGNSGNNVLNGGFGADSLIGGPGNDIYQLGDTYDTVTEWASEGNDTIEAGFSIDLQVYRNVENVSLSGNGNVNLTGNNEANVLTGNSGNNVLDGVFGGDTMAGGAGNDVYYAHSTDRVIEHAGEGTDTIYAAGPFNLFGTFVENLVLTGSQAVLCEGNSLDNNLTGNSANNVILGDYGNDRLTGGAGRDEFDFIGNFGHDTITDFSIAEHDVVRIYHIGSHYGLTQAGPDAVLTLKGQSITFLNTLADHSLLTRIQFID